MSNNMMTLKGVVQWDPVLSSIHTGTEYIKELLIAFIFTSRIILLISS